MSRAVSPQARWGDGLAGTQARGTQLSAKGDAHSARLLLGLWLCRQPSARWVSSYQQR